MLRAEARKKHFEICDDEEEEAFITTVEDAEVGSSRQNNGCIARMMKFLKVMIAFYCLHLSAELWV